MPYQPSRRQVITAAAGLAAVIATMRPALSAGAAAAPSAPADILSAYRKMRFALHNRPVYWWMKATKYGLVEDVLTPLYGMDIASIFKVENDAEGFVARSLEIVYSTDLASGELLREWENPYTGKVTAVNNVPVGPNTVRHTVDGPVLPTSLPGAKLEGRHASELWAESGGLWYRDDSSAVVTQLDGRSAKPFRVYDWPTYHSRLADIADPTIDSAPCTVSFQAVSTWQRWMGMADTPGNLMTRGAGQKVERFDELPETFRNLLAELHPKIAEDPAAALDMEPFRFER